MPKPGYGLMGEKTYLKDFKPLSKRGKAPSFGCTVPLSANLNRENLCLKASKPAIPATGFS
jgi:hypothetical protein